MSDKPKSRQIMWQEVQKANGRCVSCGKPRGLDGTKLHCRLHADAQAARALARYHRSK